MKDRWVLLAEDDKLFATLFGRFWKERFPDIPLVCVGTVSGAREELKNREAPLVAILDHTLEDGTSEHLYSELSCPSLLWSACAEGELQAKPTGRDELTTAVRKVGEMGGLVPPQ
ncbi:MAG: hypothetical protein KC800_30910 [Candidatus Eremiobacteraeota bacterium]|nr:hypothetical protein [Candidatus Eremiobacteraeota bacterium]